MPTIGLQSGDYAVRSGRGACIYASIGVERESQQAGITAHYGRRAGDRKHPASRSARDTPLRPASVSLPGRVKH